jgi:hypothetical protein
MVDKNERKDLWWISDERFLGLEDERKKQLLNPSRTVTLPDIDVTSHILNNDITIATGMVALIKKRLNAEKLVDPVMLDDLRDSLNIIANFIKAYGIVK